MTNLVVVKSASRVDPKTTVRTKVLTKALEDKARTEKGVDADGDRARQRKAPMATEQEKDREMLLAKPARKARLVATKAASLLAEPLVLALRSRSLKCA